MKFDTSGAVCRRPVDMSKNIVWGNFVDYVLSMWCQWAKIKYAHTLLFIAEPAYQRVGQYSDITFICIRLGGSQSETRKAHNMPKWRRFRSRTMRRS